MNFMFSWQEQISHSFAFLPLEHKIHIFSPPCNILYLLLLLLLLLILLLSNIRAQRGARTHDPEIHALPPELAGHVEFGVLVFVRLLLLYHLLITTTPGRSVLIISIKQELTCYLETRCLSPAAIDALS